MPVLSNSPSLQMPIRLERAKSFAFDTVWKNTVGNVLDISGCAIKLTVREHAYRGGAVVLEAFATVSAEEGRAVFALQADDLDLDPGTYLYALTLKTADDYVTPILKGEFEIVDNVEDGWVAEEYSTTDVPTELTLELQKNNSFTVTVDPPAPIGFPARLTSEALDAAYLRQRFVGGSFTGMPDENGDVVVAFPDGPLDFTPSTVVVTMKSHLGQWAVCYDAPTDTGFTARIFNAAGVVETPVVGYYLAME